jgi:hypothetical protein
MKYSLNRIGNTNDLMNAMLTHLMVSRMFRLRNWIIR